MGSRYYGARNRGNANKRSAYDEDESRSAKEKEVNLLLYILYADVLYLKYNVSVTIF